MPPVAYRKVFKANMRVVVVEGQSTIFTFKKLYDFVHYNEILHF